MYVPSHLLDWIAVDSGGTVNPGGNRNIDHGHGTLHSL